MRKFWRRTQPDESTRTSTRTSVHLGTDVELKVSATRHTGRSPICLVTVQTSDDKFSLNFFLDEPEYSNFIDRFQLDETVYMIGGNWAGTVRTPQDRMWSDDPEWSDDPA